jgi:putative oxidoreductase
LYGAPVHRLFSNFVRGWPALGLLLIRAVAGAFLITDGIANCAEGTHALLAILGVLALGAGALLAAGLWTPAAGLLTVAVSISEIHIFHENPGSGVLLATMGAAVALVGPGAVSVDAWVFGLKRIDIDKLTGSPRP